MPSTPIYGLPFEHPVTDQPGKSLHGGTSGTEPILAEEVETELARIDGDVAGVSDRVTEIEDNGPPYGWTYITHGATTSVTTQSLDVTDGGRFASGAFQMLKLTVRFDLDATGYVFARINGAADGAYNSGGYGYDCDGNQEVLIHGGVSNNSFRIGYGATVASNNITAQFMHTHIVAAVNFQSFSGRMSSSSGSHVGANFWGNRTTSIGPTTSLDLIAADGATQFTQLWWWLEGFRVPA